MNKLLFILIIACISILPIKAQKPHWIDFHKRKELFPNSEFFVGYSWGETKNRDKNIDKIIISLKDNAISELSQSIQVTVESNTLSISEENNEIYNDYFKNRISSYSKVNVIGLKTETYYDKRKQIAYAIAYSKRDDIISYNKEIITNKIASIEQKINVATQYESNNDIQNALKSYFECLPFFREIEEAQTLSIALNSKSTNINYLDIDKTNELKTKIETEISKLNNSNLLSLDDVCYFIAYGFYLQNEKFNDNIRLANFTYQDSKMGSVFSRRFNKIFEQKLVNVANYNIISEAKFSLQSNYQKQNKYLLTGTYWETGDNLKIIALLRNTESGKAIASVESNLQLSWLKKNNISYKPENFEEAYSNMLAFSKDEVIGGGLLIDVWTNKGDENLIYTKGEILKLYIRANHECYLRFIYYLADGSKIMLLDDYYIDVNKVNQVVELPYKLECTEPFGVETLQLIAQSEKFEPLNISEKYEYKFIVDDLITIIRNVRGFKIVDDKSLKAEKRLIFTTLKN
jgi:hypothetical protein